MALPAQADAEHSPWWYIAAFAGGILGGFIAFFALRADAPHMSKYCLLIGIIGEILAVLFLYAIGVDCLALISL